LGEKQTFYYTIQMTADGKVAGLEFEEEDYAEIDRYCKEVKMPWFASCWDEHSVDVIDQFDVPCYKIASASLTDASLAMYVLLWGI